MSARGWKLVGMPEVGNQLVCQRGERENSWYARARKLVGMPELGN
jgi:hypothetical protein